MKFTVVFISFLFFAYSNSLGVSPENAADDEKNIILPVEDPITGWRLDTLPQKVDDKSQLVINFRDSIKEYVYSSVKNISYGNKTYANFITPFERGQSAFNLGDTIFSIKNFGNALVTVLGSHKSKSFIFEGMAAKKPHSNTVDVMDWNGEHYVYISEWDGEHRCFVEHIWFNPVSKKWLTKLVQTLSLDIPDSIRGNGNMDWIIDKENGLIYTQTYKDGSSRTAKELVYLQFRLPEINAGDVTFRAADIDRVYNRPMIYVTQDKKIYKNQMYIVSGAPGTKYKRMISIFDLPEMTKSKEIDLTLIDEEPEGLFFYKDKLMMQYKAGVYRIQEKPALNLYFKDGGSVSFALEDIKSINFK